MAKVVTYECDQCGCEITVSETPDTELTPIYCCGTEVTEVSSKKRKTAKKTVRKTAKKAGRTTATKKPAPKKKTSKKSR